MTTIAEAAITARIRVTYMPRMGVLVMGERNECAAEGVFTRQDAVDALRRLGFVVTCEWLPGQYDAESTYCARTWA
jgi:hypothetical protein